MSELLWHQDCLRIASLDRHAYRATRSHHIYKLECLKGSDHDTAVGHMVHVCTCSMSKKSVDSCTWCYSDYTETDSFYSLPSSSASMARAAAKILVARLSTPCLEYSRHRLAAAAVLAARLRASSPSTQDRWRHTCMSAGQPMR